MGKENNGVNLEPQAEVDTPHLMWLVPPSCVCHKQLFCLGLACFTFC